MPVCESLSCKHPKDSYFIFPILQFNHMKLLGAELCCFLLIRAAFYWFLFVVCCDISNNSCLWSFYLVLYWWSVTLIKKEKEKEKSPNLWCLLISAVWIIPTPLANFRLSTWYCWMQSLEVMHTLGFCELAQVSSKPITFLIYRNSNLIMTGIYSSEETSLYFN